MRCYVAGPMTNLPKFNFDTFDEVTAVLRDGGWTVDNPHEHDKEVYPTIDDAEATKTGDVVALGAEIGFTLAGALSWDLARIIEGDAIVMLPGWEKSTGARYERVVAEATGKQVYIARSFYDGVMTEWEFAEDTQKRMDVRVLERLPEAAGATSGAGRL